jgi:hypothetical protein
VSTDTKLAQQFAFCPPEQGHLKADVPDRLKQSIARQSLGMQRELAARRAGVGGDDRYLDAELVRRAGLPLPMHSVSGAWKEYNFQPRWRCCWDRIWEARASGRANAALKVRVAFDLAPDVTDQAA